MRLGIGRMGMMLFVSRQTKDISFVIGKGVREGSLLCKVSSCFSQLCFRKSVLFITQSGAVGEQGEDSNMAEGAEVKRVFK